MTIKVVEAEVDQARPVIRISLNETVKKLKFPEAWQEENSLSPMSFYRTPRLGAKSKHLLPHINDGNNLSIY